MDSNSRQVSFEEKIIALGELSSLMSVEMTRERLLALFASKLHTLFGAKALAIWSYNEDTEEVVLTYGHDLSKQVLEHCKKPVSELDFPEVRLAIDSGTVWTTEDIQDAPLFQDKRVRGFMESMHTQAIMSVALRALTKLVGAISLYYDSPRQFITQDKALAQAFANSLALSLSNINSYAQLVTSEKMKGEMIDIVAHQFRTPITTLRGNVELLKDDAIGGDEKQRKEILEDLAKVGEKLNMFVNNFLNVKAIDSGKLAAQPKTLDVNDLVQRIVDNLGVFRKKHEIEVAVYGLEGGGVIDVDPTHAGEALTNVVNNAIKYSRTKVEITIRRDSDNIVFEVRDDGVGIPKKEQQFIFDKLFRASNVARHPEASSGLGLYIAKQYAEQNGGKIWFESEGKDKGTTFFVSFPEHVSS